ncbi:hypothetical protein GGR52DRAFT_586175 [Hypoxylon sp. FL1284]|nr:hypothetical protein GGR52DRAFT_586175 [Hypoxylon sp. FL1284]
MLNVSSAPYAVNTSSASDFRDIIAVAGNHNIRLVIRNTGHDYTGKSMGAGALAIWAYHIKDTTVIDYTSLGYTGKAISIGAGVQAFEARVVARANGLVVPEGDCASVGVAGGHRRGSGGGTYSVVLAMTVKLHQDQPMAGAILSFTESPETYWDTIRAFLINLLLVTDSGASVYF